MILMKRMSSRVGLAGVLAGLLLPLMGCDLIKTWFGPAKENVQQQPAKNEGREMPKLSDKLHKECQKQIAEAQGIQQRILTVSGERTKGNTLDPFNEMMMILGNAESKASLYANVHPDKETREVEEKCEQEVQKIYTDMALSRPLFEAFSGVKSDGQDIKTKRFIEKVIRDFKRSGVDKDEPTRAQIKKINEELVLIGQEFDRNIREDVRSIELESEKNLEGLPEDYIKAHAPKEPGKKITVTTDYPDFVPFMQYARDAAARQKLMEVSLNRAYPKNVEILKRLLTKRHELASILGYPNWAAYATEDKMIRTDAAVADFVKKVAQLAIARAKNDIDAMLVEKRKDFPEAKTIEEWEKSYYQDRVKSTLHKLDNKEVREYFPAARVKEGILSVTQRLFKLRYEKAADAEVWHPSVEAYDVFESVENRKLGRIYLDLYPRDGKYKHAAQFELRTGVAGKQLPEGAIVCNFPEPKPGDPGLMEHKDVETIFHEFGHLLHHILGGGQEWKKFSGVATEWDFVEVPSQLLEEWARDAQILRTFALHYKTNEPIPETLVDKMRRADKFGIGVHVRQQMFYAALSLFFHNQNPAGFDPDQLMKELKSGYSAFPYMAGTHFQSSFGHLNGYSSNYYTYMWSLVIAKDLLGAFRTKDGRPDLWNETAAKKYRDTVLIPGGSKDAAELVRDFLGRESSFEEFRKWLTEE